MSVNIKKTLTDNINSTKVLNLASGLFPGVIQTAIGFYLNGVTIPIGNSASFTVSGTGANLKVEMKPVAFDGSATADKATLKVSGTGTYADASITVTFTKVSDTEVTINLAAAMGNSLKWKLSDLWPALLNHEPFTEVEFEKGQLSLTISNQKKIDFSGSGALYYKSSELATGAIRIIYDGKTTGTPDASKVSVLTGVVVDSWSPGSIWSPLNEVTFKESGLIFSSLPDSDNATLAGLNLFSGGSVPSIVDGDFKVPAGISFFTSLELEKFLKPLENFLGTNETLALFANSNLSKKLQIIAQFTTGKFKPNPKAIFEFEGFKLEWDIDVGVSYTIIASASGKFFPPDGSVGGIGLTLNSTIKPSEGDISVGLAIEDWVHPFGYKHLTVKEVEADFILGASADGVTIAVSGDFGFTADDGNSFEFGVAGEIADFEVPTGIAFLIKEDSPGKMLSIGDFINGVTSLDTSSIPGIDFINKILQIKNVDFAVVEGPSLKIGDKTFPKGFTADADFEILEEEEVIIDVVITGDPGSEQFSGLAELVDPVKFGSAFLLCQYDPTTKKPVTDKGPIIAVSSKGEKIDGVNDGNPVYFYANGYLELLNIIEADLYGIATTDGLFEFTESVTEGAKFGNAGEWGGESITVGLNPSDYKFDAAFDFDFGWKNVSLGPLKIFGEDLIPKINLPNFELSAGLGIFVDGKALTFELKGEFTFKFVGVDLSYGSPGKLKTIFSIALGDTIKTLEDVMAHIWTWLEDNIASLLETIWKDLEKFVDWVIANLKKLGLEIVAIAKAIWNGITNSVLDLVRALWKIGFSAFEILKTLVHDLGLEFKEVEKAIQKIFASGGCAMTSAAQLPTLMN